MNHELPDVKLALEKAEEPEIKVPTSTESSRKQEFQKNTYFCFTDYTKAFDCVDHNKLVNSSRDGTIQPPDLPPEKSVCRSGSRSGHRKTDWLQIETGVCQGCIPSPCLFNSYSEYIMRNTSWMKQKLESRLPGKISIPQIHI